MIPQVHVCDLEPKAHISGNFSIPQILSTVWSQNYKEINVASIYSRAAGSERACFSSSLWEILPLPEDFTILFTIVCQKSAFYFPSTAQSRNLIAILNLFSASTVLQSLVQTAVKTWIKFITQPNPSLNPPNIKCINKHSCLWSGLNRASVEGRRSFSKGSNSLSSIANLVKP